MNLGVYITAKNDDCFIADVIKPVIEVFPQARVIDLGSYDNTIQKVKETGISYEIRTCNTGGEYTALKNEYSKKHDWAFWVDSDEIYPLESLHRMRELISSPEHQTMRCSWKMIRKQNDKYEVSKETKINGHKAYNTQLYAYCRSWPREVLQGKKRLKEPDDYFNGVWCWHAVLLQRSSMPEYKSRKEKRLSKIQPYDEYFTWEEVEELPWRR